MRLQRWSSQHVNENGEQIIETGRDLKGFLGAHGLNRLFVDSTARTFGMHTSQDAGMLFSCFSPKGNRKKVAVYGLGGKVSASADTGRMTEYNTVYFAEPQEIMGELFFDEVFGRAYLNQTEQRVQSVEYIVERKQWELDCADDMICSIMERFWHCQEENANSCFILMLPSEKILEQSVSVLCKVYRLIPQRLRVESGFAVDIRAEDLERTLSEMSISFVTMKRAFYDEVAAKKKNVDVIFDCENWRAEECDAERLQKIRRLWRLVKENPSLVDAKLAYAEQYVINCAGNRAKYPGFVHMQKILDMVLREAQDYFWWENPSLESLNELYDGYCQQQKMIDEADGLTEQARNILNQERNRFLVARLTQSSCRERLFESIDEDAELFFTKEVPQVRDLLETLAAATNEWQRRVENTEKNLEDACLQNARMKEEWENTQDELLKIQDDLKTVQGEKQKAEKAWKQSQEILQKEKSERESAAEKAKVHERCIRELEGRLKEYQGVREKLSVIKVDGVEEESDGAAFETEEMEEHFGGTDVCQQEKRNRWSASGTVSQRKSKVLEKIKFYRMLATTSLTLNIILLIALAVVCVLFLR